jgi:hypothetical protein
MNYRYLGKTGLKVSELCLGAMTFGRENEATEEERFQMMDRFIEAGGNFIDTANVYSAGVSEEIIGRWLTKQRRDDLVIATKVRFPMGSGPNDLGLSRKHILSSIEASLRRLQTDYIDLYQVHCWDEKTPLEETLSTLNDLVRKGAVRCFGGKQFRRLAAAAWNRREPGERLGIVRLPSTTVQSVVPEHRMGIDSAQHSRRAGSYPLESAPGRVAFRKVQARDDCTSRGLANLKWEPETVGPALISRCGRKVYPE